VERVHEAADQHGGDILDDVDEGVAVERQVHGAADARVAERRFLVVDEDRLDDALGKLRRRHARRLLGLAPAHRIEQPPVVELAGQERGAELGRERRHVIDLEPIDVG